MSSLYSPRWHRVAALRPRLAPQLRCSRQRLRGERWMLLADPAGGRSVRLNATAYALAGRLDGRRTMQQLWDWQLAQAGDPATQDELIDMLAQLREAALLQFDRAADFDRLLPHLEQLASPRGRAACKAWRGGCFRAAHGSPGCSASAACWCWRCSMARHCGRTASAGWRRRASRCLPR